jgi:tetratricopeptide (TPR) repeat protein
MDGMRHPEFDPVGLELRLNAVYHTLASVPERDPQVPYIVRLAEGLRKAIKKRTAHLAVPALLNYADWLAVDSRFEEGLSVLDTGRFATEGHHAESDTKLQRRRGYVLRHIGRLNAAATAYRDGMNTAANAGNEYLEVRCKNGLALVLMHQGRVREAIHLLQAIKKVAENKGLRRAQACASHDLAIALSSYEKTALKSLADAYHLYDDQSSKSRAISDLCRFLVAAGHFEEARRCSDLMVLQKEGSAFRATALGTELWLAGQAQDRAAFERARKEAEMMDDTMATKSRVDVRLRIGQGYLFFGDLTKARQYLNFANELLDAQEGDMSSAAVKEATDVLNGNRSLDLIQIRPRRLSASRVSSLDSSGGLAAMLHDAIGIVGDFRLQQPV